MNYSPVAISPQRNSQWLYFALAYSITWLLWLPLLLAGPGVAESEANVKYCHLLGGIGPALAALIVARIREGGEGFRHLLAGLTRWRVPASMIVLGIFGPILLYLFSVLICMVVGLDVPDVSRFGLSLQYPELGRQLYWLATIICFGWGEEIGWRGFALPRLQARFSPLIAALVLALFWSLWHLPAFFYDRDYMQMGIAGALGWLFSMVTGSVIVSWLYNVSRGSVLVVALFHGVLDIAFNSPGSASLPTVMGVLLTVCGIAIVVMTRGRLGVASKDCVVESNNPLPK